MFILPQIIYDELDMFYLAGSKPGHIKHMRSFRALHIPAQQIIGGDMEEIRNSYQHIY